MRSILFSLALLLAFCPQLGHAKEKDGNPYEASSPEPELESQSDPVELRNAVEHLESGAWPDWLRRPLAFGTLSASLGSGYIASQLVPPFLLEGHTWALLFIPVGMSVSAVSFYELSRRGIETLFRSSLRNDWIPEARDAYERAAQKYFETAKPIPEALKNRMQVLDEKYGTRCAQMFSRL